MFASRGRARSVGQANDRTFLDEVLRDLFLSSDSCVKTWRQRSALLALLEPRDRLRLLGLVRLSLGVTMEWWKAQYLKFVEPILYWME